MMRAVYAATTGEGAARVKASAVMKQQLSLEVVCCDATAIGPGRYMKHKLMTEPDARLNSTPALNAYVVQPCNAMLNR